jgi:hypothetical protein
MIAIANDSGSFFRSGRSAPSPGHLLSRGDALACACACPVPKRQPPTRTLTRARTYMSIHAT